MALSKVLDGKYDDDEEFMASLSFLWLEYEDIFHVKKRVRNYICATYASSDQGPNNNDSESEDDDDEEDEIPVGLSNKRRLNENKSRNVGYEFVCTDMHVPFPNLDFMTLCKAVLEVSLKAYQKMEKICSSSPSPISASIRDKLARKIDRKFQKNVFDHIIKELPWTRVEKVSHLHT